MDCLFHINTLGLSATGEQIKEEKSKWKNLFWQKSFQLILTDKEAIFSPVWDKNTAEIHKVSQEAKKIVILMVSCLFFIYFSDWMIILFPFLPSSRSQRQTWIYRHSGHFSTIIKAQTLLEMKARKKPLSSNQLSRFCSVFQQKYKNKNTFCWRFKISPETTKTTNKQLRVLL